MTGEKESDLEERIEDLKDKTRGSVGDREPIEFPDLREVVIEADQKGGSPRREVEFHVLEDLAPDQVRGIERAMDYVELSREVRKTLSNELDRLYSYHLLRYEDEDEIGEMLENLERTEEEVFGQALNKIYYTNSDLLVDYADQLLDSDNDTIHNALVNLSVKDPEKMKRVTPEFFERFKSGEHRTLFCNFLARLSRTDPNYAEEWVEKTFEELTDEELEKTPDPEQLDPIRDCVETMARWCPDVASTLRPNQEDRQLLYGVASKEVSRWDRRRGRGAGMPMDLRLRLGLGEYRELRRLAGEKENNVAGVVKSAIEEYLEREEKG